MDPLMVSEYADTIFYIILFYIFFTSISSADIYFTPDFLCDGAY